MPKSYALRDPRHAKNVLEHGIITVVNASGFSDGRRDHSSDSEWAGDMVRVTNQPGKLARVRGAAGTNNLLQVMIEPDWQVTPTANRDTYRIMADPNGEGRVESYLRGASQQGVTTGLAGNPYPVGRSVKGFDAILDVTETASGGTPTLDVWMQTKLPCTTDLWTDIARFATVVETTGSQHLSYPGPARGGAGVQAEAGAVTVDNYFARQAATLSASTVRLIPLGVALRLWYVVTFGGGPTGGYSFGVWLAKHG